MQKIHVLLMFILFSVSQLKAQNLDKELESIIAPLITSISGQSVKNIAIADFTLLDGTPTELGKYLAKEFTYSIVSAPKKTFGVIDRSRVSALLQENKLGGSGLIDPITILKLGKIKGFDAVIAGTLISKGDAIRLIVNVWNLETQDIIATGKGDISRTNSIIEMEGKKADTIKHINNGITLNIPVKIHTGNRTQFSFGFKLEHPLWYIKTKVEPINIGGKLVGITWDNKWLGLAQLNDKTKTPTSDFVKSKNIVMATNPLINFYQGPSLVSDSIYTFYLNQVSDYYLFNENLSSPFNYRFNISYNLNSKIINNITLGLILRDYQFLLITSNYRVFTTINTKAKTNTTSRIDTFFFPYPEAKINNNNVKSIATIGVGKSYIINESKSLNIDWNLIYGRGINNASDVLLGDVFISKGLKKLNWLNIVGGLSLQYWIFREKFDTVAPLGRNVVVEQKSFRINASMGFTINI